MELVLLLFAAFAMYLAILYLLLTYIYDDRDFIDLIKRKEAEKHTE